MWDTRSGKVEGQLIGHSGPVMCVQLEQSMNTIVSGSRDNSIRVTLAFNSIISLTGLGHKSEQT